MANISCEACNDLRELDPSLIANGFSDTECASLKNDTGLVTSSGNSDCDDLDMMNDCLVGNMAAEVETYDVCDWKDFMKSFIPNLWTMLKGVICAICGLWTNVHNLWTTIRSFCITKSGTTVSLTSNLGTHCSITIPDTDTTYSLSKSNDTITLTGSDGSTSSVTDSNTRYQLHTTTYTKENITVAAGGTEIIDVDISQPSGYSDTLYPMAIAGWTWEGTNASYLITRYIQLVGRSGSSPKVRIAVRNIMSAASDGSHDASVTVYPEVLWWGLRTD